MTTLRTLTFVVTEMVDVDHETTYRVTAVQPDGCATSAGEATDTKGVLERVEREMRIFRKEPRR